MKKSKLKVINLVFVLVISGLTIGLLFLPSGFENPQNILSERVKAEVLEVDNTEVLQFGIVKTGTQVVKVKIIEGIFKGDEYTGYNQLIGKMDRDKFFSVGDTAFVVLEIVNGKVNFTNVIDHYRLNIEISLAGLFVLMLIGFAGWTGFKALISFAFTVVMIWKILLPAFLHGFNPILVSLGVVLVLSTVIIFLVAGLSKKGVVAILGAGSGILVTCVLSLVFGQEFRIHGAINPFSEALLYSGFPHLDLSAIFLSGIFLASSGAVMDIAMDISASMNELACKNPQISVKELIFSGFRVGRAVIGTMTTTLLLAYSGGYTTMLMTFIAQGTPIQNVLNFNYISAEILHTLVGSFGLVLIAPLTAIIGGIIYGVKQKTIEKSAIESETIEV